MLSNWLYKFQYLLHTHIHTKRNIVLMFHIDKKLLEAFRTDCQTLITRFELSYNTHFQNFCDTWKEMQFSLIFK